MPAPGRLVQVGNRLGNLNVAGPVLAAGRDPGESWHSDSTRVPVMLAVVASGLGTCGICTLDSAMLHGPTCRCKYQLYAAVWALVRLVFPGQGVACRLCTRCSGGASVATSV